MRRLALAAAAALALVAATAAPGRAAPAFDVLLLASTHHPQATAAWPYAVVVTDSKGRFVRARIHLQITLGSLPVGQVGRHAIDGLWAETLEWPKDSVGQQLTFELQVSAFGATKRVRYAVTPKAGPPPKVARTLKLDAAGKRLAAAVGNLHGPKAASLSVRAPGAFQVRWSVTCNRARGSGTTVVAGVARASGKLERALTIPRGATQDCAVGAAATGGSRVSVTLTGR